LLQQGRLNCINARTPRPLTNTITALKNHLEQSRTGEEGRAALHWVDGAAQPRPRDPATSSFIAFKSSNTSFAARIEAQDHLYAGRAVI